VRNFGDWTDTSGSDDFGGVAFAANSRYGWCLDSHMHHTHGNGIVTSRATALEAQAPAMDIYIGRNNVHHHKETCIVDKHGIRVIVSQNKLWHIRRSDSSSFGPALAVLNNDQAPAWPYSDNYWVLFNEIYDAQHGIATSLAPFLRQPFDLDQDGTVEDGEEIQAFLPGKTRLYAIGNIIHHIQCFETDCENLGHALRQGLRNPVEARYVNNTVFQCDKGFTMGFVEPYQFASAAIVNNLFYTEASQKTSDVSVGDSLSLGRLELDYNLHYESPATFLLTVQCGDGTYTSVADVKNETIFCECSNCTPMAGHFCQHSIEDDPSVADADGLNFHPQTGSPCIGAGTSDVAYSLFNTVFPVAQFGSIRHDFDGNSFLVADIPIGALK
jgi:hypothetical protein